MFNRLIVIMIMIASGDELMKGLIKVFMIDVGNNFFIVYDKDGYNTMLLF